MGKYLDYDGVAALGAKMLDAFDAAGDADSVEELLMIITSVAMQGQTGWVAKLKAGTSWRGVSADADRDTWVWNTSDSVAPGFNDTSSYGDGFKGILKVAYISPTAFSQQQRCCGCSSMTYFNARALDISAMTTLYQAFQNCSSLVSLDVSGWDTSKITSLQNMFSGCSSLTTLDVSGWDTSKVTIMISTFYGCSALTTLDVSNWDTSKVTSFRYMFSGCSALTALDVSGWDTAAVTNMSYIFSDCSSLTSLDVSVWDTSAVTNMTSMFYGWDTSAVTNMTSMFYGCSSLTSLDLSSFDTSQVTWLQNIFYNCSSLTTLDLSSFDTSLVTGTYAAYGMFTNCTALRYITLGAGWFNSSRTRSFVEAKNLGVDADGNDNGWIAHLADVLPEITDGEARTVTLPAKLKSKSWAADYITSM